MNTRSNTALLALAAVILVAGFAAGRSERLRSLADPTQVARMAMDALDHGDTTDAFTLMSKAAAKGDASAAYHLGMMYEYGEGTAPDAVRAIDWLTRAADAGSIAAARQLGSLYLEGTDTTQDFTRARDWYAVAAAAGDRTALDKLGEMYAEGFGAPADPVKGYAYYAAAAARGSVHDAARRDRIAARLDPQQQSRGEAEARKILAVIPSPPNSTAKAAATTPASVPVTDAARDASSLGASSPAAKAVN
jgi:TPR repeat protein